MGQIRVGKPDVAVDAPTHVSGIEQGNSRNLGKEQPGHHRDGTGSARRSTGISPKRRDPILAVMPNLSPG